MDAHASRAPRRFAGDKPVTAGAATPTAACLLLCALPLLADAALVRANCRGIQKLSTTEDTVSCQESNVLSSGEHVILGHTRASASLSGHALAASAAGGQIRDVGANGGESGALLKDRLTLKGDWEGHVVVGIRLCVTYRFAGFGESRIHATLRTAAGSGGAGENRARVRLVHRGFVGTRLDDFESRGHYAIPEPGARPSAATFVLRVTERVHRDAPSLDVRADIAAFALPNLEPLEPVLSSLGRAVARLAITVPDPIGVAWESGVLPGGPPADRAGGERWVIMQAAEEGSDHALRSDRGRHGAAARSDC